MVLPSALAVLRLIVSSNLVGACTGSPIGFSALVMVFALGMERLETRLRSGTVREDEVEDFLERARPDEVKALFRQGIGGALQMFRLRNLGKRGGLGARRAKDQD